MNNIKFNSMIRRLGSSEKAFNEIYAEFFPLLVRHLERKFKGQSIDADAIAQDTFLKLMNTKIKDYINNPVGWLYTVCDRLAYTALDRIPQTQELTEEAVADDTLNHYFGSEELIHRLGELDSQSAEILCLHYYEGYSLKEIAAKLNLNYNTVRQKCSRAKKYLAQFKDEF